MLTLWQNILNVHKFLGLKQDFTKIYVQYGAVALILAVGNVVMWGW